MAGGDNRNTQKIELRQITSLKGKPGYHITGQLLSLSDISVFLEDNRDNLSDIGSKMLERLTIVKPHQFQHLQVSFPVSSLRHDTDWDSVLGIIKKDSYNPRGFIAKNHQGRPEFNDLSFWSINISSGDIEFGCQEAYNAVSKVMTPINAEKYRDEILASVANSPAFEETSRYGNFRFTFPLSDLLSWYKSQYCGNKQPQFRILGTETFRLEIVHYIVVCSPDTSQFYDLPEVPRVTSSPGSSDFVYWKEETLYWRPESTSNGLKVMITEDGDVLKKCSCSCSDKIDSVWNHLVFSFHIPKNGVLEIPKQDVLNNLSVCDIGKPFLGKKQKVMPLMTAQKNVDGLKINTFRNNYGDPDGK